MTLDQINMVIDPVVMAVAIPTIIAVTNGINTFFKIEDGNAKRVMTVIVTFAAYLAIIFKDSTTVFYASSLVIMLFGAAGIYNFLPGKKEESEIKTIEVREIIKQEPETIEQIIRKNEER